VRTFRSAVGLGRRFLKIGRSVVGSTCLRLEKTMLPIKKAAAKPAALPAVQRKSQMTSIAYNALSPADKKESHRLEFVARPAVVFAPTDYLYHATSTAAVGAIRVSGLTTRDARNLPAQDPSKDAFISAATTVAGAGSLSSSSTLLRFRPSQVPGTPPWKSYGAAGEVRSMSAVPANVLERRVGTNWVPI
jgi:hypothetical protein